MTKAIKNVSDDSWREFKALAGLNKMRLGEYFEKMVEISKKDSLSADDKWSEIFALRDNPLIKDSRTAKRRARAVRDGFRR